jgi:two-component system OmpR family response regulator
LTILLIDDDAAFATMMSEYLVMEGFQCSSVTDAAQGLEMALSGQFEVVILDVMMPHLDGIEVLRRIRRASALPVIMLTAKGDNLDRVNGLELGADDYLPKPVYPLEVAARIRAVLRRVRSEDLGPNTVPEIAIGNMRILARRREVFVLDQPCAITATEFDILLQLAQTPDAVVTKDHLYRQVLHRTREPYDRSVDVHVSNLRYKLTNAGSTVQIETRRGIGYHLKEG